MATSSSGNDTECTKCEENGCYGFHVPAHYIGEVKKKICHACALQKGLFHLLGHKKWLCERHKDLVTSFCVSHDEGCCKSCALIFHQKPCKLLDVSQVLEDKRQLLNAKLPLKEEVTKMLKECVWRMNGIAVPAVQKSFQKMESDVVEHFAKVFKREDEWEKEALLLIDKEYEEKWRKLQEEKEEVLRHIREEARQRRKPILENKKSMIDDIQRCHKVTTAGIGKLQHDISRLRRTMHELKVKINNVLHGEQETVLKSGEVCMEIDGTLAEVKKIYKILDDTTAIINSISLLSKRRNGKEYHRLDFSLHGSWKLVDEFRIPSHLKDMRILGCAFNENAFFQDVKTGVGYIYDSMKREMKQVLQYDGRGLINYCTPFDDELLLCGRTRAGCSDKVLNGCICLYDRQWQLKGNINIPRNAPGTFSCVSVDVTSDGKIVAAEAKQSQIYAINPNDNSEMKSIRLESIRCKRFLCMQSGDLVVSTGKGEFHLVDHTGFTKNILRDDDWVTAVDFSLDPLLNIIYVVYWVRNENLYAVDEVSADGNKSKKIVTFPQANWTDPTPKVCTYPIVITHAGRLIACNEDTILFFKKTVYFSDYYENL